MFGLHNAVSIFDMTHFTCWNIVLKSTAALGLCALACTLLAQQSAAIRHRVWVFGLIASLILPLASLLVPKITLRVLPSEVDASTLVSGKEVPAAPSVVSSNAILPSSVDGLALNSTRQQPSLALNSVSTRSANGDPPTKGVHVSVWQVVESTGITKWFGIGWLIGTAFSAVWFMILLFQQSNWLRRLRRIDDEEWATSVANAAKTIGLQRPMISLESDETCVPAVAGVLFTRLLVPRNWRAWSQTQRTCILLHELAHVKRSDVYTQLLGRLACLVYWFNPLVWYAARQLRAEREVASDDVVLLAGQKASDYAESLLCTLKSYRPVRPVLGVAIAHSDRLDQRVLAILDTDRCRNPVGPLATIALPLAALVMCGVLGGITVASRMADAAPSELGALKPKKTISIENVNQLKPVFEVEKRANRIVIGPKKGELTLLDRGRQVEVVDDVTLSTLRQFGPIQWPQDFEISSNGQYMAWNEIHKPGYTLTRVVDDHSVFIPLGKTPGYARFSPDSKYLAIGDTIWSEVAEGRGYNEMKLFDLTGKLIRKFEQTGSPGALKPVFSPNGKILAVSNRNDVTQLYDVATGKRLHSLGKAMTQEITFSPDGKTLAAGYVDGAVALWDVATGMLRSERPSGGNEVFSIDFSIDGKVLVSSGKGGKIVFWNAKTLEQLHVLEAPVWVAQVKFTPDGTRLLSSSSSDYGAEHDRKIVVWALPEDAKE